MFKVSQVIGRLAGILANEGDVPTCTVIWGTDDVLARAADRKLALTPGQAHRVLALMRDRHDCEVGINWGVIDVHTDWVLEQDARGTDEDMDFTALFQKALSLLRAAQPCLIGESEALDDLRDGSMAVDKALKALVSARINEFCTRHDRAALADSKASLELSDSIEQFCKD